MLAATAVQHQFVPLLSVNCILKFVSLLGIYDHAISRSGFRLNEHRLRDRLCLFRGNSSVLIEQRATSRCFWRWHLICCRRRRLLRIRNCRTAIR
jgi:hypothetical protein